MNIVAVGGGEIGRPGTRIETLKIDREIIALSGKKVPKLLFIPTASRDSQGYVQVVEKYFGRKLGCRIDTLLLHDKRLSKTQIEKKIFAADIIYVGGGNTLHMLKTWRKLGVDKILSKAAAKGKILSGVSAGAICWFQYANSDSHKMTNPSSDYIRIRGLNFISLFVVPHFDVEKDRQVSLKKMLKRTKQVAVGLDNCSALVITNNNCKIITSNSKAAVYLCYWKAGKYFNQRLKENQNLPLTNLLRAA